MPPRGPGTNVLRGEGTNPLIIIPRGQWKKAGRYVREAPPGTSPPPDGTPSTIPGWEVNAASAFLQGDHSIKIVANGSATFASLTSGTDTVPDGLIGRTYTAEAWVRADNPQTVGKQIRLVWRERLAAGGVNPADASAPVITLSSSYQRIAAEFVALETGSAVDVRVSLVAAAAGDTFQVQTIPPFSYSSPPPPDPDPDPEPGGMANWTGYSATHTQDPSTDVVTVTSTGVGTSFAVYTSEGIVDDSVPGRTYTGTARLKGLDRADATGTTVGRVATLIWREWLANGNVRQGQTTITLSSVYQEVQATYVALEDGRPVDLRVSVTGAAGDRFAIEDTPTWDYVQGTPPGGGGGDPIGTAFDYPFDPLALVRTRIDGVTTLRTGSAAAVTRFNSELAESSYRLLTLNSGEAPAIWEGRPTDPTWTVTVGGYSNSEWRLRDGAQDGGGSDHPLIIRMASHPTHGDFIEMRLWQAVWDRTNRRLSATNYGLFRYNNDGAKLDGGRRSVGRSIENSGARGAGNGLTYSAGLITRQEVIDGAINHVLRFAFGPGGKTAGGNITSSYVAPAIKSDQVGTGTGAVPMGVRFRLKASVDANARTAPGKADSSPETRFVRMVCRALQLYGFMPADGGGVMGLYMEANASAGWSGIIGATYSGSYGYLLRDERCTSDGFSRDETSGIPWGDLEVIEDLPEVLT
jgi:hypothetical protein